MKMTHLVINVSAILILAFFGFDAQAQIYKCQENSKTVFRDKPCQGGEGEKFNLGATIENTDPTGTLGDVSGSWKENGQKIPIRDALGILDRKESQLSLYLVPDRFTASEVQHFQDTGDDSELKQKPAGTYPGLTAYPFLNLRIQFRKDQARNRDTIESAELLMYGSGGEQPRVVKLDAGQAMESIRFLSLFEDVSYGDINLESDGNTEESSWKISVKAPIYYR